MSERDRLEIRKKVLDGVDLAFTRMLQEKAKENKELVLSRNGRLEIVKASDLY